jgi:hypothetical protein
MGTDRYVTWDPTEWEIYSTQILRHRYGIELIPVPDKSGGDGGLDAYVRSGYAWQMYACENEPLQPRIRYDLQRGKITKDVGKLQKYSGRVSDILGNTVLTDWILMTPYHESSDLIVHCNNKAAEVRQWGLPFISDQFHISVHTLDDYPIEHRALQTAGVLPGELHTAARPPEFDTAGVLFSQATSPLISRMDGKLSAVVPNPATRGYLRGEMLSSKIAGDDLLARYDEMVPDIAAVMRHEIALAKRRMLMSQARGIELNTHIDTVRADIIERLQDVVDNLTKSNAEFAAEAYVVAWLQECSMDFIAEESL